MKHLNPDEGNAGASSNEHKVFKVVNSHLCSCLSLGTYSVRYRVGENTQLGKW